MNSIILFKKFDHPDKFGNKHPTIVEYTSTIHWIFSCLRNVVEMPDETTPPAIIITSINDSDHLPESKHYRNQAIDIRSKNFPDKKSKDRFRLRLESNLNAHPHFPNRFIVILEYEGEMREHFHVQVRKGMVF